MDYLKDDGKFIKNLFKKQAVLNVFACLTSAVGPIVCAVLTGAFYGESGLAIVAACSPLFFAASFFGFIIAGGAQILCSEYIAKNNSEGLNGVYSSCVGLTVIFDVFVCALLILAKVPFLKFAAGEISPEISAYYNFFVVNAFFTMLIYIPLFFSKIADEPLIGLVLTISLSVFSIVFAATLNFFLGVEAFALGQAIGTALALIISMSFLRKRFKFKFSKDMLRLNICAKIFALGSPIGLSRLYVLLTTLILNRLFFAAGGNGGLAVFGVISTLLRFDTALNAGITQTLIPLTAVFGEEKDAASVRQTVKFSFLYGNALLIITGALLIIFSSQISAVFGLGETSEACEILIKSMPFYALYALILLNVSIFSSYFNAVKRLAFSNIITLFQEFLSVCAFALIFAVNLGIGGLIYAFPASGISALLIIAVGLFNYKRKNPSLILPLLIDKKLEDLGAHVSFSVKPTPAEIALASAKIGEFCEENNVSPSQTMMISMSAEELINLYIDNSKKKLGSVAIRLFIFEKSVVLRIRSDGEKFDVMEYYKNNVAEDLEKSLDLIGMKYVYETAEAIYYNRIFSMNNLVVIGRLE